MNTQKFSLIPGHHGHYWVFHGGEKIAIFGPSAAGGCDYSLGLFRQGPGKSVPSDWLVEPEILHFVTRRGLGLTTHWMNAAMAGVAPILTVDESDSSRLRLVLTARKSAEEHGEIAIVFRLDGETGRYVVDVEYNLTLAEKGGGEFCNFYPHGAGDFRPGCGRYDRILWQDSRGKTRIHWLNTIVPQPSPIELSTTGAFVFLDEPEGNPAVIYESARPAVKTDMCLCWFDNHMLWAEPTQGAGPYHYHAKLKAYWLTAAETRELARQAEVVSLQPFASKWDEYLPVGMGGVNDFERTVDLRNPEKPAVKRMYFPLGKKGDGSITWDDAAAHSGARSLLFQLGGPGEINERFWGPELLVTPGKQVCVSAWVKTEQVEGEGFWLETSFGRWDGGKGRGRLGGPFLSEKLVGTRDWRKLSIPLPLTPPKTEWLENRIQFRFKGSGKVWLDDFVFEER